MTTYEIYLDGSLASSADLAGIAYLQFESARLLGDASLVRIEETGDPVLDGKWAYNPEDGGWDYQGPNTAPCPPGEERCKYQRKPFNLPLQRNALRVEIVSPAYRCGWSLRAGRIGGCDEDYHVCRRSA